ncbi:hypothetical protein CBS101457_005896 [Exobasidium rhododendri]|nr:hypothetical protein CBS101457_005896 [Exobasidium rhododendri]
MGSDLSTLHPTPSFGRSRKPGRQRTEDDGEGDAFVASSPRQSLSYAGPVKDERYGHNDNVRMSDMNGHYYYGSEGFQQDYQPYSQEGVQFVEPKWDHDTQQPMGGYVQDYGHQVNNAASLPSGQYSYPQPPPAASQYSASGQTMGAQTHPSSSHASYPDQHSSSTYPQEAYMQESYPQDQRSQGIYQQPAASYHEGSYGHDYAAARPAEQSAPPAYPESSHAHNHDLPKSRQGPAAV